MMQPTSPKLSKFSARRQKEPGCSDTIAGLFEALILPAILAGLGLVAISLAGIFIYVLLRDFVVPIMCMDRNAICSPMQKFFSLLLPNFFYFIGYGLFLLCLSLLIVAAIVVAGCITCCIGFIILGISYIAAVVLLPVFYAIRSFSVEFLEQFGPEFLIFPRPDLVPPDTGTAAN